MLGSLIARLVGLAARCAWLVVLASALVTLAAGWHAATHLTVDSDIEQLLPKEPAWRQNEFALDRAFPQNASLLAIVIDGATPELADDGARRLTEQLRRQPELFRYIRQPDGGPFFERNGALFLPVDKLTDMSNQLVTAQPLIGSVAQDPSLRGLFDALKLFVDGARQGHAELGQLDPVLTALDKGVRAALGGNTQPLSWQQIMSGAAPARRELRRFVLARPVLDFTSIEPGTKATNEVRRLAHELGLDPAHGVRLRITGPVALGDEQFATLREGAWRSTAFSIVSVCAVLFAAVRSVKLVGAILATMFAGLVLTAGFATVAIGSLNLISVAFGVLFIGLAVDFSIQFSVRYRDQRHRLGTLGAALDSAAHGIGPALLLAAGATALGFLAFVPTAYSGVRELGLIAGIGMVIAIILNFTLLPALLMMLRPRGEPEPVGFRRAAFLDRLIVEHRTRILAAAGVLAVTGLALLPRIGFDFDPLHLKNPNSESVATALDMIDDPTTSPYAAEILAPTLEAGQALAARLAKLPEVAEAVTAASYIPEDQDEKLAIVADLALLLGPTLFPAATLPPPSDADVMKSLGECREALEAAAHGPQSPAGRLADALAEAIRRGPGIVPALREVLLAGLVQRIDILRETLQAKPVTLAELPPELRDSWIAPDGRARVEVFPRGDARDSAVLERFVAAIRTVAPDATGAPVTMQESGRLITGAFLQAGVTAVIAIIVLLAVVLRRPREVALVLAPLLLAAVLTLAVTIVTGMRLNYANIIALPLLLGIGVAFDIYFVMNWRAGITHHLQSSTTRAVIFSALTTTLAFGSLALSNDPGTAGMGEMLSLSLACTLFCTVVVLPALLGPAPVQQSRMQPTPGGAAAGGAAAGGAAAGGAAAGGAAPAPAPQPVSDRLPDR